MKLTIPIQTLAVLATGALLGYIAASSGPQTPAQAEIARPAASDESATSKSDSQVPCCDAKITRTSALAESVQVADASAAFAAHNLAVATTAQTSGKKPNILVLHTPADESADNGRFSRDLAADHDRWTNRYRLGQEPDKRSRADR